MISDSKKGKGSNPSSSAINKETGTRIKTVVTLLRNEEKTAVIPVKRTSIHTGLPLTSFANFMARNWNIPVSLRMLTITIIQKRRNIRSNQWHIPCHKRLRFGLLY